MKSDFTVNAKSDHGKRMVLWLFYHIKTKKSIGIFKSAPERIEKKNETAKKPKSACSARLFGGLGFVGFA